MRDLKQWFDAYGESHTHQTNVLIHKVCVPLIMLTILGILWALPTPEFFTTNPFANWATLFGASCMIFYASLGIRPALVMLFQVSLMLWILHWINVTVGNLMVLSVTVFVIAWIFQFIGHKIEGKKPSFLQDLQFLLVGPLWVSKKIFFKGL